MDVKRLLAGWRRDAKRLPCRWVAARNERRGDAYDLRSTFVVAGVPRGGTTWMGELLGELDDCLQLWEPLNRSTLARIADLPFTWRQHIPADADWPEAEDFFRRLFGGRILHPLLLRPWDVPLRPSARHLVKFCRANRLLPWLVRRLDLRPPVLLVRHPCAVVASQLRFGSWDLRDRPYRLPDGRYAEVYAPYRERLERLETPEARLAATWSLDHLVPLSDPLNDRAWITVSYERLVREGETELKRVFDRLGEPVPSASLARLRRPSATTIAGSAILEGGDQLAGWRRRLDAEQVRRVLDTVAAFGLADVYTDALEPDYDALTRPGPGFPPPA